jgi:hypothetical protein
MQATGRIDLQEQTVYASVHFMYNRERSNLLMHLLEINPFQMLCRCGGQIAFAAGRELVVEAKMATANDTIPCATESGSRLDPNMLAIRT